MNRLPEFDPLSFSIGAIAGSIFWAILAALRPSLRSALEMVKKQRQQVKLRASSGIEDSHRKIIHQQSQEYHLAASLFSLDEIAVEPRLLAPPAQIEPGMIPPHEDIVEKTLPYLPEWSEVGAFYGAQTLSLAEAVSGEANLVVTGQPGGGKSTALAYLASQIVNRQAGAASLHEKIPFLIHVSDLGLPLAETKKPEDLLAPIIAHQSGRASVFDIPRIASFVQYAFQSGRALFLIDGLDEMPQPQIQEACAYLRLLLRAYPQTRVIAAGAQEYIDGLLKLGFIPMALLAWTSQKQQEFLEKWGALWQQYVRNESWAQTTPAVDNLLLKRWLTQDNFGLTPLEYTLKIWAAYAGDARGPRPLDGIEAHIRRLSPTNVPLQALQMLGAQSNLNALAVFPENQAKEWVKSFEQEQSEPTPTAEEPPVETEAGPAESALEDIQPDEKKSPKKTPAPAANASLVGKLAASGLLQTLPKNMLRFSHPVFGAYLAGQALRGPGAAEPILKQPVWSGRTQVMRFLAAFSDATPLIQSLLAENDPLLMRPQIDVAKMLREAPHNAPWRNPAIASLISILQNDDQPLALRGQLIAAFAVSDDPNMAALFRQLLQSPSDELRRLAALGIGLMRDGKAVNSLGYLLSQSIGPTQRAACLALVAIGTPPALEAVATALLQGDEDLRQAAAEALANDPQEGREALREGINSDDILMRRAITYGLARIPEDWATELLQKTQIEDTQWVVRNVAVELLDNRQRPNPRIPRRLSAPAETPWLIEFAGRQGLGISPGQVATDLLMLAFKSENEDERRAALAYLRHSPSEGIIADFYRAYFGSDRDLKEMVYHTLKDYACGGVELPAPMQFGLG
ncbi:MAG: HEAT repeat domain-containing protein [Anaerolineales bacterium]|jgi:HEAT repeat protein|nr:HEAT repeat domain-containing protein [Anaerolineales bacterium]